jgi:hypothetical protein
MIKIIVFIIIVAAAVATGIHVARKSRRLFFGDEKKS